MSYAKKGSAWLLAGVLTLLAVGCGSTDPSADASDSTTSDAAYSETTLDTEDTAADADGEGDTGETAAAEAVYDEVSDADDVLRHGRTLSYPHIDPSALSNEAIGWGMGPDRDELNRPLTALQYQEEYADCNVDFIVPTEEKVLYLTFDEGYEGGYTESMLDTLAAHDAQGIFFVTKPYVESRPDLVQRMIDEGHVLGNHTVHHPSDGLCVYDEAYQTNEVMELHDYVKEQFDYDMFLFRYPTGKFSRQSLAIVSNCGYRSVFWSFAYADWDRDQQPDPTEALDNLEAKLHPGAIYLLHAVSSTNTSILDAFLTDAASQGYTVGHYTDTLD